MDIKAIRKQLTDGLGVAIKTLCSEYQGVCKHEIQALLKLGHVWNAYRLLTQTSQDVAYMSKRDHSSN